MPAMHAVEPKDSTSAVSDRPHHRPAGEGDSHGVPADLYKPRTVTVIAVILFFIIMLGGLFALGWFPHHNAEAQAQDDAGHAGDLPIVSVTQPRAASSTSDLTLPCDVKPNQETSIYPRAHGYLKKLYVDIQDHVTEGQLLAEIDTPEVDAELIQSRSELEQSQARLTSAEAEMELSRRTAERYKEVRQLTNANVTDQELDEKQSAFKKAQGAVSQATASVHTAEAEVKRLEVMQSFEKITASFSGTITARNFDVGALLTPGDTSPGKELFHLVQSNVMRVFVHVPQTYATDFTEGGPATLLVRNYPGREFHGRVARSSGSIDLSMRTMLVELHFENTDGALLAGMYGQVSLGLSRQKSAYTIPTSAMIFNAAGIQVATVKDGHAHFQIITVGRDLGTELEILSGVSSDDQVITNPGERIREGAPVQILSAEPRTADAKPSGAVETTQHGKPAETAEKEVKAFSPKTQL